MKVRLLDLPVELWARTDDETRDLMREFALIGLDKHHLEVPNRLLQLVTDLQVSYGDLGEVQTAILQRASETGAAYVDELVYEVPVRIEADIIRLGQMLDEADQYCLAGEHLLSLAASPGAKAFRQWFIDEFCRQVGGAAPVSWRKSEFARRLETAPVE